ncbi:Hypothetical predicted protein, partial [Mytilus galloprovincialis]
LPIGLPPPLRKCSKNIRPVCGADGITHSNLCIARRLGIPVLCRKPCPCDCRCKTNNNPVCGVDGKNYTNKCIAQRCKKVKVQCRGRCPCKPKKCRKCPRRGDPVCGSDGITYNNECRAKCQYTSFRMMIDQSTSPDMDLIMSLIER